MAVLEEMRSLVTDLAAGKAQRRSEVVELRTEMAGLLRRLRCDRIEHAGDQRRMLATARVVLAGATSDFLAGANAARRALAAKQHTALVTKRVALAHETLAFLGDARRAREKAAQAQRRELATMRRALRSYTIEGGASRRRERAKLGRTLREVREVWRSFNRAHTGRGTSAADWPGGERSPTGTTGDSTPTATALREDSPAMPSESAVVSYLSDRPDGVRLTELERHFGLPRIRLAGVIAQLMESKQVWKDDEQLVYHAA